MPPSSAARFASSAKRVGFWVREYSKPVCSPGAFCANVDVRNTGVMTAPVTGSGCCPAWTAAVSKRTAAVRRGFGERFGFIARCARPGTR